MKQMSVSERGMEPELKEKVDVIPTNYTYISTQLELIALLDVAVKHWCGASKNVSISLNFSLLFDQSLSFVI